ncbi:type IV toxin-antitoxin system AbiEi family antitoxin [Isoptericola sp. AK164]|uniref:type IV toxin-antitoxin system AbiEi family antitoxin n=1 Tax=Isoptericola sp. AK164 TaxID=3024246 RepID=UPI0024183007|nr:type IV toxin-antitoxin system AbiEi family antitoxin [Isoptericola sp. AK164]
MSDVDTLVKRIATRWHDDGVELTLAGPVARIEVDGMSSERRWWWFDAKDPEHRRALRAADSLEDLLLIGDKIPLSVAERTRERGGWHIDAAGNAYVRAPGVHIDVHGRRTASRTERKTRLSTAQETNLMSAGRAQVIFCLLSWPDLVSMPIRAIADVAGVSPGTAHTTIKALTEEDYLFLGASVIARREELLDRWATAFPLGLGRSLELGRFCGKPDLSAWEATGSSVRVSGEYAADNIRGTDLTLYAKELEPALIARSRWRRPEPGESANIIVRRKFWTEPTSPLGRNTGAPSIRRAPALLVYADLLASREPRQQETARAMRGDLVDQGG